MLGQFKFLLLLLFVSIGANAQIGEPSRLPNPNAPIGYYKIGYMHADAFLFTERDTFCAKYPTLIKHPDHHFYYTNGNCTPWFPFPNSTSVLNIITDSSITICSNGTNLCDTIYTTVTAQLVTILTDTSVKVCDLDGNCDTLFIPPTQFQSNDWHITGNAGTNPTFNFLGTTDSVDMKFRANNQPNGFLSANVTTIANTAYGYHTLNNVITSGGFGSFNTAIGFNAMPATTTGFSSVAVGIRALQANTTGFQNVAIGGSALRDNLVGSNSVAVGYRALELSNVTASTTLTNIAIGSSSMRQTTSGYSNVAVGSSSLLANTTGIENAVLGTAGLFRNTTGSQNTVAGRSSAQNITTGNFNTVIGMNAGFNIVNGSYNTVLGANVTASNTNNNLYIGDGQGNLFITGNSARRLTFPAYGAGTFTGTPTYSLQVDASGNVIEGAVSSAVSNTDSLFGVADNSATQERVFDFNSHSFKLNNVVEQTAIDSSTSTLILEADSIKRINAGYFLPNIHPDICLTGCAVTLSDTATNSYTYVIAASTYYVNNVFHTSPQRTVTLPAADATNDRVDLFVLQSSNVSNSLTGTAANPALDPDYDATTQLPIGRATVSAATVAPTITTTVIYKENAGTPTEYTTAVSNASINANSTNNPWAGSKDVEWTTVTTGRFITYTWTTTIDFSDVNDLIFRIRSKANWQTTRKILMQWYNGNTPVGVAIPFGSGSYGFNSANTTGYQLIDIQLADFGNITGATRLRMQASITGGGSVGLYMDNIMLVSETNITAPTGILAVNGISPITVTTTNNVATVRVDTNIVATQNYVTNHKTRFGIEDNTGVQNRNVDMGQFDFNLTNVNDLFLEGGNNTDLFNGLSANNGSSNELYHLNSFLLNYKGINDYSRVNLRDTSAKLQIFTGDLDNHINVSGTQISVIQADNTLPATLKQFFVTPTNKTGNYYIPLSVNGNTADSTGDITTATGTTETASNGLTKTVDDIQLGGVLTQNTTINGSSLYTLNLTGSETDSALFQITNSNGIGIGVTAPLSTGISTSSDYGIAIQANTVYGTPVIASTNSITTNDITVGLSIRRNTSNTPADGIGSSIEFFTESTLSDRMSSTLTSKWTTVTDASRTSQFIVTGVNNAITGDILTINAGGALKYTVNTVSGTTNILTANSARLQVFTGSSASTWTLPAIGNTGLEFVIKNRGSVNIILNSNSGGNDIYNTSVGSSLTILPGESYVLTEDGTYFIVN